MSSRARRFLRNSLWSLMGQWGSAILALFLTPYILHGLGEQVYSLYIIMIAVTTYLLLLCLGATPGTIRFLAAAAGSGRGGAFRRVIKVSFVMHAAGVFAAAAAVWVGAGAVASRVFHIPPELAGPAAFAIRSSAAASAAAALVLFAGGVLQGLHQFKLFNLIVFVQNGLMVLAAALMVRLGLGIRAVALCYAGLNVLAALAAVPAALRAARAACPPGGEGELSLKEFVGFCLYQAPGPAAWAVVYQLDKVFLARGASLAAVTLYSIPAGMLQRFQILAGAVASVIFPIMSEIGSSDAESLRRVYLRALRFLLYLSLPAFVLLFAFMPQFLSLWVGMDFGEKSVWPARLLIGAQIFYFLLVIPAWAVTSRGKPYYATAAYWAQALLSLIGWKILIPRLGLLGAAVSSLAAQALPDLVLIFLAHRRVLGISASRYFEEGLSRPALSAAVLFILIFPVHAWAGSWWSLTSLCAAGLAVNGALSWMLLRREDRDFARALISEKVLQFKRSR